MKTYFVYILKCKGEKYYVGITSDVFRRLQEHQEGKHRDSFTYRRRPVELQYYCEFTEPEKAINFEKQIKKWSRAKKEALINGAYDELPNLAKKKFK